MNNKQSKKIRKLYNRDFKCLSKDIINYIYSNKPWYIPKFIIKIILKIK